MKEEDAKTLDNLVKRASEIMNNEITFKKIFDNGIEKRF